MLNVMLVTKHPEQFTSLVYSMCFYSALRKILKKTRSFDLGTIKLSEWNDIFGK